MSVRFSLKFCSSFLVALLFLFLINSCQKTVDDLDNENPPEPPVAVGDSTCLFTTINFDDDTDRKYSKHFEMDAEGNPVRCYEVDFLGELFDWEMKFSAGRIDLVHGQSIRLDGNGRVTESYTNIGMHVAGDIVLTKKYFYDPAGYLIRIEQVSNREPENYNSVVSYSWSAGNLEKIRFDAASGYDSEVNFKYDSTAQIGNFMDERNLDLVMYFQHFLDFGKKSKNLLKSSDRLFYDTDGMVESRQKFVYSDHQFDSAGNVTDFNSTLKSYYGETEDDLVDELVTRHKLTYTCN